MLSPTETSFNLRSRSLIAKVLFALFLVVLIAHLTLYTRTSQRAERILTALNYDSQGNVLKDMIKHFSNGTSSDLNPNYERTFISYGDTKCLPPFNDNLKQLVRERNQSCRSAPFPVHETERVAIATWIVGQPQEAYLRAIQSHMVQSALHQSQTHVLCSQLLDSPFNKIAYLLNIVMNEMLKPRDERLEWILYLDGDAIIIDPCRPLSSFLPPVEEHFRNVNLLVTKDHNGLNNGAFLFRVNLWAVDLFSTILGYPYYRPDEELVWADQSAMGKLIEDEKWSHQIATMPLNWFNAFPGDKDKYKEGVTQEHWWQARKGDFVVHFAGIENRLEVMPRWHDMLKEVGNVWAKGSGQRDISQDIADYWKDWKIGNLSEAQKIGQPSTKKYTELMNEMERLKSEGGDKLKDVKEELEELRKLEKEEEEKEEEGEGEEKEKEKEKEREHKEAEGLDQEHLESPKGKKQDL